MTWICKGVYKVPTNYKYISTMTLIVSSTLSLRKIYCVCCNYNYYLLFTKTFWKIESVNKVCFDVDNGQKNFLFRNKTFLFFKIESWDFQVHFEIEFHDTLQNFNSIRQPIKKDEDKNSLNKLNEFWNFVRFHEFKFQTEPGSFSFCF